MMGKSDTISKGVAVIGSSAAAIQSALTLAQMGVNVKIITNSAALGGDSVTSDVSGNSSLDQRYLWPLLLRAATHPLITLYSNTEVENIDGQKDDFKIQVAQHPRYIHDDLCTSCGVCQAECSAKVTSLFRNQKITHSAIHPPLLDTKAIPSAYVIEKNGFAPCYVECPLGINVQGFVALLAKGKTDKALALINESAPLAGILGRVCGHPCEDNCNRTQIDSPVSIQALHRYAADNVPGDITYSRKSPAKSREEKVAIVGSGPAGLTAAWELTRRGYSPTVFESHAVIGGMLATGIPRFRLPREVREREIEAIKNLGVDIRTGITVGRDVTFAYLKERGYKAFFLSIGTQRNNKLNIPGEELEGVVDCMPLLLTLNLKVTTFFVGSNVVVIGGGNAAIDAARSARRAGAKKVTVLYRRNRDDMPANSEEVEEAIKEGVSIEFCILPVEILGDEGKVTGIRCQRAIMSDEVMADGRRSPEPIPDTDFVLNIDHVVVAIGQSPDTSQLDIEELKIDSNTGVIQVNPLTLKSSIPGTFAGGDCITGPNNVVEAMADGLRAAESIDRYIQECDLKEGRSLEPPQIADFDIETAEVSPHERASMPVISPQKRARTFEETTTGLSAEAAQIEAQRCLDCALCSQCMECARVCQLGAVFHDDITRHFEIGAQTILSFHPGNLKDYTAAYDADHEPAIDVIHIVPPDGNGQPANQLSEAMALALESASKIKPTEEQNNQEQDSKERGTNSERPLQTQGQVTDNKRIGVFLCSCGGTISSVVDFKTVTRRLSDFPGVTCIREIAQACTEAGAAQISNEVAQSQLNHVVLAACRCCNLEHVCYSCTDRRIMCQQYLHEYLTLPHNTTIEFCNIREQCAWAHQDDPKGATRKAVHLISSEVTRARVAPPLSLEEKPILPSALIVGGGTAGITAARALASQGYHVELVARQGQHKSSKTINTMLEQLPEEALAVKPWPNGLKLYGSPGNYEAVLEYGSQVDSVTTGAVLADIEELNKEESPLLNTTSAGGLLSRLIYRTDTQSSPDCVSGDLLREVTIKETSGIFLLPPDGAKSPDEQALHGLAAAARVSTYLEQATVSPRALAVTIDSKMCRVCGNCSDICPYIEMTTREDGTLYAYLDATLCLGCGACITICPSGAITQPHQSDKQIISTLRSILQSSQILSEV